MVNSLRPQKTKAKEKRKRKKRTLNELSSPLSRILPVTVPEKSTKEIMRSPHPGDYNQPSEQAFRSVQREDSVERSRDDPHTTDLDDRGRARRTKEEGQRPRRRPTTSRSRSRSSGSASKRLANSRPRSKMRAASKGKPDYRYAYY